jgi:small subunit ribosomal protein S16
LLRIRLSRVGKKKQPSYRIVVADSRSPRDGAFLKIIGHYNPLTNPATLAIQKEEAVRWLKQGAQPSETAAKLLTRAGVMEKAGRPPFIYKGPDAPQGKKKKKGEEAEPATSASASAQDEAEPPQQAEAAAESSTDTVAKAEPKTDVAAQGKQAETED